MNSSARLLPAILVLTIPVSSGAAVQVLEQSATIRSLSSYYCSETESDSVEDEATYTDLSGLDQSVTTSIVGSCGSSNGEARIRSAFTEDSITIQGDCSAGATQTDFDIGGHGQSLYEFEINFSLDAPTLCIAGANSFGGGQGSSGGSSRAEFVGADGTVYFSEAWPLDFMGGEVRLELSLPAGEYSMRGSGSFGATQHGGGGSGTHYVQFLNAIGISELSVGMLKARY